MAVKLTNFCDVCGQLCAVGQNLKKSILWINGQYREIETCSDCCSKLTLGIEEFFESSGESFGTVLSVVSNTSQSEDKFICSRCSFEAEKAVIENYIYCPNCGGVIQK